jgi:hypothetical protein
MVLIFIFGLVLVARYALGASWGPSDAWDAVSGAVNGGLSKADQELGNAADAFGINYDETKKAAGTIAGAYYGGAYGQGLEALGMGVTGGMAGGAAAGGAAAGGAGANAYANAYANYMLRPDGTFVDSTKAPYAASDTYGGYDPSKRDWFYNQEQNMRNKTGHGYTKQEFELAQAQYGSDQNRSNNLAAIQQWQQSRNPYYESLYKQMTGDANNSLQQQYADSLKHSQLQHATRGTLGGSQDAYNTSQLNTRLATERGKAAQSAQNYVQGIRQGDQQQAQTLAQQQYAPDPYLQALYQSQLTAAGQGSDTYKSLAAMQLAAMQDSQQNQNNMSQIYGGQIGTVGTGVQSYIGAMQ